MCRKQAVSITALLLTTLLLITGFVFFACGTSVTEIEKIVDAQTPRIAADSTESFWYKIGDDLPDLKVTATVTDKGTLTYQWFKYDFDRGIGAAIDGQTDPVLALDPITAETYGRPYRYYVTITNENQSATGRKKAALDVVIEIMPYDAINAQMPLITKQPVGGIFNLSARMAVGISAASYTESGGEITYQWYQAESAVADHGILLEGRTSSAVNLTRDLFTTEGTYYFFVVATNTDIKVTGRRESQTISDVAVVQVVRPSDAAVPEVTAQPEGLILFVGDPVAAADMVTVKADSEDGGELSYQWYRNGSNSNANGSIIAGATGESLKLSDAGLTTASPANTYYYAVVTNTNDDAKVNPTRTITSNIARVTVQDKKYPGTPGIDVEVDFTRKYQYVRGFGGMDVAWANFPTYTMADYENMFNPNKLGYNMVRIMVPPNYTNINRTMEELVANKISGAMDRSNYYEFVKLVNKYGGYVLASPWTPPAAWKTNNSVNGGGTLRPSNYQDFADYLRAYCQIMADNGAPIYAVALQNEPTWVAGYDGCEYTPEQNKEFFVKTGHFTTRNNKGAYAPIPGYGGGRPQPFVRTMGGESHNEIATFHTPAMMDRDTRNAIDIIGAHIYGAGPRRYSLGALTDNAGDKDWTSSSTPPFPTAGWNPPGWTPKVNAGTGTGDTDAKEIWMTEHNINGGNSLAYVLDSQWEYVWKFMNDVDLVIRINQENAFIWWSAKRFYSMIGDGSYSTTDGAIMPRGYGLSHYARFAKETGRVGVKASGFLADDSTKVSDANVNNTTYSTTADNAAARITAFVTLNDGSTKDWRKDRDTITVADIQSISLVMYTPTLTGSGGFNLGNVKIKMPDGFLIRDAALMRSTSKEKQKMETVPINPDRKTAYVSLPVSNIVSVKFTKQ
jgi:O-glycosyl hydrolase